MRAIPAEKAGPDYMLPIGFKKTFAASHTADSIREASRLVVSVRRPL
jgi:hypothetical protein